jgi:hypothetical protein
MIGKLAGALFVLIGYVSTATVITLLTGLAYLWQSDQLNDQKVFKMMALFHDVDLNQMAEAQRKKADEVPPEEVSLEQALRRQQVMDRNFEVKLLSLRRGRQEFDHRLQQLKELIDRYDRIAQDFQNKLKQQQELTTQENLSTVVRHLESINPAQAKEELLQWLNEGRTDDAILLMTKMSESKLKKILQKFQSDDELTKLYEIHKRIIDRGQKEESLEQAIDELKTLSTPN